MKWKKERKVGRKVVSNGFSKCLGRSIEDKETTGGTGRSLYWRKRLYGPHLRGHSIRGVYLVDRGDLLAKLSQAKADGSSLKEALGGRCVLIRPSAMWIEDTAIASPILLAAEALGLGSCWIQIRERRHGSGGTAEEFVREVLTIPQNLKVEAIIALGYPAERRPGHPKEELQFEKVFTNMYGQRSG